MSDEITALRLKLRAAGYAPLPLIGKRPAMEEWSQKLNVSPDEIALWPKLYPHARNTGALTRMMPVIDADITNPEAAQAVEELAREQFEERGHFLVRTGKPPKRAFPFRTDIPFKKVKLSLIAPNGDRDQKIEVLGDGQQVVVAGIHPETKKLYSWFGGELWNIASDELPYLSKDIAVQFLKDARALLLEQFGYKQIERPKPAAEAGGNGHDAGQGNAPADWVGLLANIREGHELHDSSCSLAAKLVASGMSGGAAVNILRGLFQTSVVPHDDRWRARLDDIPRIVDSAAEKFGQPNDWREIREAAGQSEQAKPPTDIAAAFTFLGDEPAKAPRELIKKLLPAEGVVITGGQPSAGKTFFEIYKAVCMATMRPCFGHRIVERIGTAFVAAEGRPQLPNRFAAALAKASITDKLPITWPKQLPDFTSLDGLKLFIAQMKAINERFQGDFGVRLGQITIDTIAASFSMKSEDDNAEASKVCKVMRSIGDETGATMTPVHHYGKNPESGLRGASAWKGSADVIIGVLADIDPLSGRSSNRELACVKARDGEQGPLSPFDLEFIELGLDPDGDIYGSLTVVPTEGPSRFEKIAKLSKGQRAMHDAIHEALDGLGKVITPRAGMSPVRAAKVTDIRAEFDRRYVVDEGDPVKAATAKRVAFKRQLDHLPISQFGSGSADGAEWIWKIT